MEDGVTTLLPVKPNIEKSDALWAIKPEMYLATGSYCAWNKNVNLEPPSTYVGPPLYEDTVFLQYYYNILQYMLYETGFPETVDETTCETCKTLENEAKFADTVTIAILSNPIDVMGILLEGGRQCPGDMLLVLSMSWVEKRKITSSLSQSNKKDLFHLYIHKAVAFLDSGRSAIRVYNPPRRATYMMNFFTASCTGAMRNDGQDLEEDLDCTLTSRRLCLITDDKLWMRTLISHSCSSSVVQVPCTLAFIYRSARSSDWWEDAAKWRRKHDQSTSDKGSSSQSNNVTYGGKKIIHLTVASQDEEIMATAIADFLNSSEMQQSHKVVVKPSGEMWMSCMGVSIHDRHDVDSVTSAAKRLLPELQAGDAILVETFHKTLTPRHVREMTAVNRCSSLAGNDYQDTNMAMIAKLAWSATEFHSCRFRATVCRGPDNRAHMTKLVCGIGYCNQPLNGDNTVGQSLDTTLLAFGITNPDERNHAYQALKTASEAILTAIFDYEDSLSMEERGSPRSQTYLIGIDFILTDALPTSAEGTKPEPTSSLLPIAIEVNSFNCTTTCDVYESMYRLTSGETFETLIEHMIATSQQQLAIGMTLLVWGAGVKVVSDFANRCQIKVIHVVDCMNNFTATDQCQPFNLYYSQYLSDISKFTNSNEIELNAKRFIVQLRQKFATAIIDGSVSFDRFLVPMSSAVARLLELPLNHVTSAAAAMTALHVATAQQLLVTRNSAIPQWNASYLYSLLYVRGGLTSPCSSAARDWVMAHDQKFADVPADDKTIKSFNSSSQEIGTTSMPITSKSIESLVATVGQVHRVDIVVQRRKLLGGVVSDYQLKKNESNKTNETARTSPSSIDEQTTTHLANGNFDSKKESNEIIGDNTLNAVEVREGQVIDSPPSNIKSREASGYGKVEDSAVNDRSKHGVETRRQAANGPLASLNVSWPTTLPIDKKDQLLVAAYQSCNELDLVTGVFTVEMTFDAHSPKMIRVIPCLDLSTDDIVPGFINRLRTESGVDLMLYAALMCGNRGKPKLILPVEYSFQNLLASRRLNYGPPVIPYRCDCGTL